MIKRILLFLWNHFISPSYVYVKLRFDIYSYNQRKSKILEQKRAKEKIKVLFFTINIGMWKNDYLFRLLENDPRFEPCVASFFVPADNSDFQCRNQTEMRDYFISKGYTYYDMYNFETKEWLDVRSIQPDIIFYTQAVNEGYKQYKIQSLWKDVIFYYIPYSMIMAYEKAGFNTLLYNIAQKVFVHSYDVKDFWSGFFFNKASNVVVTGYTSFDYLSESIEYCCKWKCNDRRKKVIWAPHHSIMDNDVYSFSNFLEIADSMINLAEKYQNEIEFVFKPHPRLRPKLERLSDWGIDKTAAYYKKWEEMPNTNIVDGDYFDLFVTSDAMIHDCITFMAEYLYTGKPVMFNLRSDPTQELTEYGLHCFEEHYIGKSMSDIEIFLKNVVIDGIDYMKEKRLTFIENDLQNGSRESVARRIYNEIKNDLT